MMTRTRFWFALFPLSLLGVACGDGGKAGGEGGQAGSPSAEPDCTKDSECDDAIYCNGEERCVVGRCRSGVPVQCSDGIECTRDVCQETTRSCVFQAPDVDQDGHVSASCLDKNGAPLGDDCDDEDPLRYPGNAEICDPEFRDDDCDPSTLGFRDSDNDGYVDSLCCNEQEDGDLECGEDCDDFKPNVNPESPEVCDFFDNNCDGEVDEGQAIKLFPDKDHDGHGDANKDAKETCAGAVGFAAINDDCDDGDPEVFRGQFEICDGKDNNCDKDRLVDEIEEQAPWYADVDEDTYGDPESSPIFSCYRVPGRVLSRNDCNDNDPKTNRNAPEICDAKDNDCNGLADYRLKGVNDFEDDDKDGHADAACEGEADDCDDRDPRTAAGAEEVCDHVDNDCDGLVDEQTTQNIWYIDEDGDGWGVVIGSALASCDPLAARARQFGDCDDTRNEVHPNTVELCDGVDNDCDGETDEGASVLCQLSGAIAACESGICAIYTCHPGFADADGDASTGCEATANPADYITETACLSSAECNDGNLCNGIETCAGGFCRLGPAISCALAADVIQGDVTIADGRDVNSLRGIRRITGSLFIENTNLSSLVGLEGLRNIGGHLRIVGNAWLKKLSGSALSDLESVGGTITIENNRELTGVDLPSLLSAYSIVINSNLTLKTISGYGKLQTIEGIIIKNNPALEKIDAFKRLSRIGGQATPYCPDGCSYCDRLGLVLDENPELKTASGFAELKTVGGDLCLGDFQNKTTSFPKLERVESGLVLIPPRPEQTGNFSQNAAILARVLPSPLEEISFPKLTYARSMLVYYGGGDGWSKLKTLRFPLLKEIRDEAFFNLNLPELESFDLSSLTKVGRLRYYNDGGTLPSIKLNKLRTAEELQISLAGTEETIEVGALEDVGYLAINGPYPAGTMPLKAIDFASLESAGAVWILLDDVEAEAPALEAIDFSAVESFGSFSLRLTYETPVLTEIRFDALTQTGSLELITEPQAALRAIRLGSLAEVDSSLSIRVPFVPPAGAPGLELSELTVIGTTDGNQDQAPDNDGPLALCTGVLNQNQSYDNAACSILGELIEAGYVGQPDSCGQCSL